MSREQRDGKRDTHRMQFTQKSIEKIPIPKQGRVTVYDVTTPELGLRVDANGRRSFFWFKSANGQPIFRALGEYGPTLIDQARDAARDLQTKLGTWRRRKYEDPNPFLEPDRGVTLQTLVDRYCAKRVAGHAARPEKAEADVRWMVKRYLAGWKKDGDGQDVRDPGLADWTARPLGRITDQDVRDRHTYLAEHNGKVTADRVVQLLRRLFFWAVDKEKLWSGVNPARNLEFYGHTSRDRVLSAEETGKFFEALGNELNADLKDFVWLALATEARRGDLLSMRWQDISDGIWTIPNPKGGRKHSYRVALIAEAVEVLNERRARIPQDSDSPSPWVFPSDSKSGHLEEMKRGWAGLLKRAGVGDFRVHDLRHCLPSVQVNMGVSLPIIGKGLGHRPGSPATSVYANQDLKPSNVAMAAAMTKLKADADAAIAKMKAEAEAAVRAARRKTKAAKPKLLRARVAVP